MPKLDGTHLCLFLVKGRLNPAPEVKCKLAGNHFTWTHYAYYLPLTYFQVVNMKKKKENRTKGTQVPVIQHNECKGAGLDTKSLMPQSEALVMPTLFLR